MSISSAMNNAYSGLTAVSRSAEVVSNNVANALTEGYSRQYLDLSAIVLAGQGNGVSVDGVSRSEDVIATQARRRAAAEMENVSTKSKAMQRLANSLGEPGDPRALAVQYADFENAIATAISAPDSSALLHGILSAAKSLTATFNKISSEADRVRIEADAEIATNVESLNASLQQIEKLNNEIQKLSYSGRGVAALEDQRQGFIERVNSIIPVRQSKTGNGEVALYAQGGGVLLNGSARVFEFTNTPLIASSMTFSSGALSGLFVDGRPIAIGGSVGATMFEGGSLSANFQVRDVIGPEFQTKIDALAVDLIERFQNSGVDSTIVEGCAGLFTDGGSAINPADEIGVGSRIGVNPSVDPSAGGEIWRFRDGVGALTEGISGASDALVRMAGAMEEIRPSSVTIGLPLSLNGTGFAEEITSLWASTSARTEEEQVNIASFHSILRTEELNATGVDTDKEMQSLLLIEESYAANARVITVLDRLMKQLLEM